MYSTRLKTLLEYLNNFLFGFRKSRLTINVKPATFAPDKFINSAAAHAVPPVASKSSCINTFQSFLISSLCISTSEDPYSKSYLYLIVSPGNFPDFLIGIKGTT